MKEIMKKYAIFGAGELGKAAYHVIDNDCLCWVDNDVDKQGGSLFGLPIISLDEWLHNYKDTVLLLSLNYKHQREVVDLLINRKIRNYEIFDRKILSKRERVVSYAHPAAMEDLILYHVLHDIERVFYIDVGCNDPVVNSVTKLFYDRGAYGINIDPIKEYMDMYKNERGRDINICGGIGREKGKKTLYVSGGLSTMVDSYAVANGDYGGKREILVTTLSDVCHKYIPNGQDVHFLKIDVEGMEGEVIRGMDWAQYSPWILCIESTLPNTDVPCYQDWEPYLIEKGYEFVFQHSVDRYYVHKTKRQLAEKFMSVDRLLSQYYVFHVKAERC